MKNWYLSIPENHEDEGLVRKAVLDSGLPHIVIRETESDFVQLFSGLVSYVGTDTVLCAAARAQHYREFRSKNCEESTAVG